IGNMVHDFLHVPIPGSIIALVLLFISLTFKIIPEKWIENGATFLLSILMLLFVPTMVGVINHPSLLSVEGALLVLTVLLSTIVSMAIAGKTGQFLEKRTYNRKEGKPCNKHSLSA